MRYEISMRYLLTILKIIPEMVKICEKYANSWQPLHL